MFLMGIQFGEQGEDADAVGDGIVSRDMRCCCYVIKSRNGREE